MNQNLVSQTARVSRRPGLGGWLASLLWLGALTAVAQVTTFENRGSYYIPPNNANINAYNFVNQPGGVFNVQGTKIFSTGDTVNYTNFGSIIATPGFDFQTISSVNGLHTMAGNFVNVPMGYNSGIINCGGTFSTFLLAPELLYGNLTGNSKMIVNATNIINSGIITMDASSLMSLNGKNVDLSYGALEMSNPNSGGFFLTNLFGTNITFNSLFNSGVLDYYWTATTATNPFYGTELLPINIGGFSAAISPLFTVTNRSYLVYRTVVALQDPAVYANDSGIIGSNRFVQAAFVSNNDPNFQSSIYFTPFEIAVEWQYVTTNWPDRNIVTNFLYVTDNFGEVTNIGVALNGFVNPQAVWMATPTYKPINYQWAQGRYPLGGFFPPATPGLPPGLFDSTELTNQYTGWAAIFTSATALPEDIVNYSPTNMYGRIEVTAENLALRQARITALNYLRLTATNHFKGSQNALISSPYLDLNLRVTNGLFTVTNLVAPMLPHCEGPLVLYSSRWTNVTEEDVFIGGTNTTINVTNGYHVLYANNLLRPTTTPYVLNLSLTATNSRAANSPGDIVLADVLNVTNGVVLKARSITISTNDADAYIAAGELNLVDDTMMIYPTNFPGLQFFTNSGTFRSANLMYFGTSDAPLQAFVNNGGLINRGLTVNTKQFINDGSVELATGSISIEQADSVDLTSDFSSTLPMGFGAGLFAPNGAILIYSGSLIISNQAIYSGGLLDLWITNSLTDGDGGLFNDSTWNVTGSVNLNIKPARGDVLATTIYNTAPPYNRPINVWAAEDRGPSGSGFADNAAIGRLILQGSSNSVFQYVPAGAANALYVDYLEFQGSTTNRDSQGNYVGILIQPGMTIYYAEAVANGASIAEKLNGKGGATGDEGGRFVWVPGYAGTFSSTNLFYPGDPQPHTFNRALVQSFNIDSDGDGVVNGSDPTPILVSSSLQFSITRTNLPAAANRITWQSPMNSTNCLFYKTSLGSTNWQVLTNFVSSKSGRAVVLDPINTSNRYYRVRVDMPQP